MNHPGKDAMKKIPDFSILSEGAANFINSLRASPEKFFHRYAQGCPVTSIGTSCAAISFHLIDRMPTLSESEKDLWANAINSYQEDSGLYIDRVEDPINCGRENESAFLKRHGHRTFHALWALYALDRRPAKPLRFIVDYNSVEKIRAFCERSWNASAVAVMSIGIMLWHEYVFNTDKKTRDTLQVMLDLWEKKIDKETGFWKQGNDLRHAMTWSMHLYPLWWSLGRELPHYDKAVAATLPLQQPDGTFAKETGVGGGQCFDFDAGYVLVNGWHLVPRLRQEIEPAMERLAKAILINRNADGSFAHNQTDTGSIGSSQTAFKAREGGLWELESRLKVLAMHAAIFPTSPFKGSWGLDISQFSIFDGGCKFRRYYGIS